MSCVSEVELNRQVGLPGHSRFWLHIRNVIMSRTISKHTLSGVGRKGSFLTGAFKAEPRNGWCQECLECLLMPEIQVWWSWIRWEVHGRVSFSFFQFSFKIKSSTSPYWRIWEVYNIKKRKITAAKNSINKDKLSKILVHFFLIVLYMSMVKIEIQHKF